MPKKEPFNAFSKQSIQREISRRNRQPGPGDLIDQWFDRMVQGGMSYMQTAIYDLAQQVRSLWVSNSASENRPTKPRHNSKGR